LRKQSAVNQDHEQYGVHGSIICRRYAPSGALRCAAFLGLPHLYAADLRACPAATVGVMPPFRRGHDGAPHRCRPSSAGGAVAGAAVVVVKSPPSTPFQLR
jgi:hypothetical protein